jgi:hypothetical protein
MTESTFKYVCPRFILDKRCHLFYFSRENCQTFSLQNILFLWQVVWKTDHVCYFAPSNSATTVWLYNVLYTVTLHWMHRGVGGWDWARLLNLRHETNQPIWRHQKLSSLHLMSSFMLAQTTHMPSVERLQMCHMGEGLIVNIRWHGSSPEVFTSSFSTFQRVAFLSKISSNALNGSSRSTDLIAGFCSSSEVKPWQNQYPGFLLPLLFFLFSRPSPAGLLKKLASQRRGGGVGEGGGGEGGGVVSITKTWLISFPGTPTQLWGILYSLSTSYLSWSQPKVNQPVLYSTLECVSPLDKYLEFSLVLMRTSAWQRPTQLDKLKQFLFMEWTRDHNWSNRREITACY